MHPDKAHVATGQEGSSPIVLVWDSMAKPPKTEARLQLGADKNGVSQVGGDSAQRRHPLFAYARKQEYERAWLWFMQCFLLLRQNVWRSFRAENLAYFR